MFDVLSISVFDLFVVILGSVRFQYRMLISGVSLKATLWNGGIYTELFFFK